MYISKFAIENYKCFSISDELTFSPGFNVIVGRNNSGKTALVEALSLGIKNNPHLSEKTLPYPGASVSQPSKVKIKFHLTREEMFNILIDHSPSFNIYKSPNTLDTEQIEKINEFFKNEEYSLNTVYTPKGFSTSYFEEMGSLRSNQAFGYEINREDEIPTLQHRNVSISDGSGFAFTIAKHLRQRIYTFRAERFNVGQHQPGAVPILSSDASNLAQVLHYLQTKNPPRFNRFVSLLQMVFPEITQVTIPPIPENSEVVKIYLWSIDPNSEREDLAIALQESGTGVGQVMAILYVALTSDHPTSIIIDEPQSFLHPGAIRKLLQILSHQFSHHQYIVSTHSPVVISSSSPDTLVSIRKEGSSSSWNVISTDETEDLRITLADIGARLVDVFGADEILWVEGLTEELCFPMIVRTLLDRPLLGTEILGVLQVGDFEGKHSRTIFEIYRRLSTGKGILPPAVGFIFDSEARSQTDRDDLVRQSNGKVHFLERRMFENYLLIPDAICSIFLSLEEFGSDPVEIEEVALWIENNKMNSEYQDCSSGEHEITEDNWKTSIHGARFLGDLFKVLSNNKIVYEKIEYGVSLTKWILKNCPEEFREIASLLDEILENDGQHRINRLHV